MGFRELQCFNQAMLAKLGWNFIKNSDSLSARVLKGIYFPYSDFLSTKQGSRLSWLWCSLLHGREVLKQGVRWNVHIGT